MKFVSAVAVASLYNLDDLIEALDAGLLMPLISHFLTEISCKESLYFHGGGERKIV